MLTASRGCHVAQGSVLRSANGQVRLGHGNLFLENGVITEGFSGTVSGRIDGVPTSSLFMETVRALEKTG
jgi:hypothetical protein